MNLPNDISGKVFGRLTAIKLAPGKPAKWECVCSCGANVTVFAKNIKRGTTLSCGCLAREKTQERSTTHGLHKSRLYTIWRGILVRTGNPKADNYKLYGGRGITVCEEWKEFQQFYDWSISHGYDDDLSIDRYPNNDGDYEPSNCRWATQAEQARNKRSTKLTETDVASIRADLRTDQEIAADYGVGKLHIQAIKRNARWK